MPRMQTHQGGDYPADQVILGPCPGCDLWTLQYDQPMVSASYSPDEFGELVESILTAHLQECFGLREIVNGFG